jgi:hypothetical protein
MTWVLGNLSDCAPIETFANALCTPVPITDFGTLARPQYDHSDAPTTNTDLADEVDGSVPRTIESWIHAQKADVEFDDLLTMIDGKALKDDLWIYAPLTLPPTIIVPSSCKELLIRDTYMRHFHLNHAKVFALLQQSYFWSGMKSETRKLLSDCQSPPEHCPCSLSCHPHLCPQG